MVGLQRAVLVCFAPLILTACAESSAIPLVSAVATEILHEDGRTSSGFRELWASPQLSGDKERDYRLSTESANEEFDPENLAYDKDGRLWMVCRGTADLQYCDFSLVAYICRQNCSFDLKVRVTGPLKHVPVEGAPWEHEASENWVSGSFDWAKTAKRDRWDEVIRSSEGIGGTPTMQVQVKKDGLHVLLFPNRTF